MNKTILIIGGSGGIGIEIINLMLINDYKVINIDKVKVDINNKNLTSIVCDLEDTSAKKVLEEIGAKKIYGFISCIGFYAVEKLNTFSIETFYKSVKIDIEIPTDFAVELLNSSKVAKEGKLIFISSAAAYIGSRDLSYSITKSGLIGLVKGLAKNLEEKNIYVYGVAPGIVETAMSEQMDSSRQNDTINKTLNKRKCQPIEVAKLVDFIIGKEDGYMNSSIFHINNGLFSV